MYTVKVIVEGLIIHFTSPLIFLTPPRLTCPPTHIKMTLYGVSSSYEFHMSIKREVACDIMDIDLMDNFYTDKSFNSERAENKSRLYNLPTI